MKNIFKRALALTMIAVLFAVSAFAAPTFSNVAYDKTSGNLTVNVDGYTGGKDATILVLKAGVTPANATNNDIVFIDQVTVDAGKTVADYIAPIKVRANAVGATGVNVWVGGDEITTAVPYTKAGETGASEINLNDEPVPSEPTYAVEFDKTATYKTLEAAKGAVKVKKTLDGTVSYLTAGEFTVTEAETAANVYTFTVKVGDKVVGTVEGVTITPDVTPGGKTGITGVVRYPSRTAGAYENAAFATVYVTKMSLTTAGKETFEDTIVASAFTDADGKFEIELPAGMYRVVVDYNSFVRGRVVSYANTTVTQVEVKADDTALKTVVSAGQTDMILMGTFITGDANHDGVITRADINAAITAFSNLD